MSGRTSRGAAAVLGYAWAALALPVVLATFIGMNLWAPKLVAATGVTISPWYTGGEVVRKVEHASYETRIHRPVFNALIGKRKTGFVQVDFVQGPGPAPDRPALPESIDEAIDVNGDGAPDFQIAANSKAGTVVVTGLTPRVLGLDEVVSLDGGLGVRVRLRNQP
jgi:hypothetical protein